MQILGISINNLTRKQILQKLEFILSEKNKKFYQIATVNPEFILQAQKDEEFKNILNSEITLNIADGIGLKFAAWRQGKNLKYRFAGADLLQEVLKIAEKNDQKVLVITHKNSLSSESKVKIALEKLYPSLENKVIVMQRSNLCECKGWTFAELKEVFTNYRLRITDYDIVLCNLGVPHQEKLLYQLRNIKGRDLSSAELSEAKANEEVESLPNLKLAIGIGGSLDFLNGKIKRAPKWMRVIGLEWLYRLILEPRYRLKRIYNAIIVFPIKVIFKKI